MPTTRITRVEGAEGAEGAGVEALKVILRTWPLTAYLTSHHSRSSLSEMEQYAERNGMPQDEDTAQEN